MIVRGFSQSNILSHRSRPYLSGGGRRVRGRVWDTKEQCKQGKWGGVLVISYMGNSKDSTDVGEGRGGVYRSEVAR